MTTSMTGCYAAYQVLSDSGGPLLSAASAWAHAPPVRSTTAPSNGALSGYGNRYFPCLQTNLPSGECWRSVPSPPSDATSDSLPLPQCSSLGCPARDGAENLCEAQQMHYGTTFFWKESEVMPRVMPGKLKILVRVRFGAKVLTSTVPCTISNCSGYRLYSVMSCIEVCTAVVQCCKEAYNASTRFFHPEKVFWFQWLLVALL